MAIINEFGVKRKTLLEYLSEVKKKYLEIDPAWNIDPESPDGMSIAVWSEMLANLDEAIVASYHSIDPNSATGQQLDRVAAYAGIKRKPPTHSTATVLFHGDNLIEIPAGTKIRHRVSGSLWVTDVDVITSTEGQATVNVTCLESGANSANAGTLTVIATPIGGILSVTNLESASIGKAGETDIALRMRRNEEVARIGSCQVDNIYAAISETNLVKQVKIYENSENTIDANGLQPNSLAVFVDGGEAALIAKSIAIKKNPGCGLNAKTEIPNRITIETTTPLGQPFIATFFRPEYLTIYIRIDISNRKLSTSEQTQLKTNILNYVQYGFGETSGFAKTGFKIGESITTGRIYTPVNYFLGGDGEIDGIYIGLNINSLVQSRIPIKFNQLAVFDADNIEVVNV